MFGYWTFWKFRIPYYATQPMIDKPLDQLRYKKPIEDSLITYGQACSKNDVPHSLSEIAL